MSQITPYLDDATQALVEQAAAAYGVSKSRWVADPIRKHAAYDGPRNVCLAAGHSPDFPLRDGEPSAPAQDVPRMGL